MATLINVGYRLCIGVSLLALFSTLPALLADRSPAQWGLLGVFVTTVLIYLVQLPQLWHTVSNALGFPNVSGLLSHSLVIAQIGFLQLIVLYLSHDTWREIRRKLIPRLIALAGVITTMVTLFVGTVALSDHPISIAVRLAVASPAYLLVYLAAFALGQYEVARLCRQCRRVSPSPWLTRGLTLIIASVGAFVIYIAGRLAGVIAGFFGGTGHAWEPITLLACYAGTILQMIGWILPNVGRKITEGIDQRRTTQELVHLHQELVDATSVTVITSPGDRLDRVYRLAVEIRDAEWELRPWMDRATADVAAARATAAGLTGLNHAAAVEAAQLRYALAAKDSGHKPAVPMGTAKRADPTHLAEELPFLRAVAHHYRNPQIQLDDLLPTTPRELT